MFGYNRARAGFAPRSADKLTPRARAARCTVIASISILVGPSGPRRGRDHPPAPPRASTAPDTSLVTTNLLLTTSSTSARVAWPPSAFEGMCARPRRPPPRRRPAESPTARARGSTSAPRSPVRHHLHQPAALVVAQDTAPRVLIQDLNGRRAAPAVLVLDEFAAERPEPDQRPASPGAVAAAAVVPGEASHTRARPQPLRSRLLGAGFLMASRIGPTMPTRPCC